MPILRRQEIAARLRRGQAVGSLALAAEFAVSEDAIRRDLRALAAEGVGQRVYGGALPLPSAASPAGRSDASPARSRALARAAAALVREGQTVFLDSGIAQLGLAAELPSNLGLRVVTNSVPVAAQLLDRPGLGLVLIGGNVNRAVGGCVDGRAIAELSRWSIDLCFLGACALSVEHGLAAFDPVDAAFKSRLLESSATTALLLANGRIETAAPCRIGTLTDLDHIVLEHDAPAGLVSALRRALVAVTVAAPSAAGDS